MKHIPSHFFVIDVESIGLHGQAYAVAGGIYSEEGAYPGSEFRFAIDPAQADGDPDDRNWVDKNIAPIEVTHETAREMRDAFWELWMAAKAAGATMAADCLWPVEAGFVASCVADGDRKWNGPYPFAEISSYLSAAGMDPMANYDRSPEELPKHDPLADVRQSARLLWEAISKIKKIRNSAGSYMMGFSGVLDALEVDLDTEVRLRDKSTDNVLYEVTLQKLQDDLMELLDIPKEEVLDD